METFVGADGREWVKYNLGHKNAPRAPPALLPPLDSRLDHRQRREQWASQMTVQGQGPLDTCLRVLVQGAQRLEPTITPILKRIVLQSSGGMRLIDFEHKFKTPASMVFKLQRFAKRYHESHSQMSRADAEAAVLRLHTTAPGRPPDPIVVDALRYTLLVPHASYSEAVQLVRKTLTVDARMEQIDAKNFWHGEQLYRGINDVYAVKVPMAHGLMAREFFVEVQLHTPESIELKHKIHELHKQEQAASDDATRGLLRAEMLVQATALPLPRSVLTLDHQVVRPPWWK